MKPWMYSTLWWIGLPVVLVRLWWRGFKEPGYRKHWRERLGFYGTRLAGQHTLWVHAVSVGETRAAEPLITALLHAYPDSRIVLTHMTPTGRATGAALFGKHGPRLLQAYLPYDLQAIIRRFLRHYSPHICILMETEVWPNLMHACEAARVPVALVNARLSERSLRRGRRFGELMAGAARRIALVAAQTEQDAQRIRSLGAPRVEVTGSIKFDVVAPQEALDTGAWLRRCMGFRPVLLCASTRDGEEALILDALARADRLPAELLLVIVPRHPQRFDDVADMACSRGLSVQRRSALTGDAEITAQVLLGDSMGEMFAYYAASNLAFIGGSLLPLGGQNLIEACAVGTPVLIGPHTFNFAEVTQWAVEAGAALCVPDADALWLEAARLLGDTATRQAMGEQAVAFSSHQRGATVRTVGLVRPLIH